MKTLITGTLAGIVMALSGCASIQTIQATLQPWTKYTPSENYRINRHKHYSMDVKILPNKKIRNMSHYIMI